MADYKDPALMSMEERLALIESYRNRMISGENIPAEEMNHAIKCIAADRAGALRERRKASQDARKSASITPMSLDDI